MTAVDYWKGEAGDAYRDRNEYTVDNLIRRCELWGDILAEMEPKPETYFEVGANIGLNLRAIRQVRMGLPVWGTFALEPNPETAARLAIDMPHVRQVEGTAQHIAAKDGLAELVFTSGVLIHIPPDELLQACKEIHRVSRKWIVAIEYFSKEPRMVPYRGEDDRLWTRDFGSFYLDNFPDLTPVACGFAWKRLTGLDDLTWWVLRK